MQKTTFEMNRWLIGSFVRLQVLIDQAMSRTFQVAGFGELIGCFLFFAVLFALPSVGWGQNPDNRARTDNYNTNYTDFVADAPWRMNYGEDIPIHIYIKDANLRTDIQLDYIDIYYKFASEDVSKFRKLTFGSYSEEQFKTMFLNTSQANADYGIQAFAFGKKAFVNTPGAIKSNDQTIEFIDDYLANGFDLDQKMFYFDFLIPHNALLNSEKIIDIKIVFQINNLDNSPDPIYLRVFRYDTNLPKLTNWYRGDMHVHTLFTNNFLEFGNSLGATKLAGKKIGLDWFTPTNHTADFDALHNDGNIEKTWQYQQDEIIKFNKQDNSLIMIAGQELHAINKLGRQLHNLVYPAYENPLGSFCVGDGGDFVDYLPGYKQVNRTMQGDDGINEQISNFKNGKGIWYIAHPFATKDIISPTWPYRGGLANIGHPDFPKNGTNFKIGGEILCNDGNSNNSDIFANTSDKVFIDGLTGLQIWNLGKELYTTDVKSMLLSDDYVRYDFWGIGNENNLKSLNEDRVEEHHIERFKQGLEVYDFLLKKGLEGKNQGKTNWKLFIGSGSDAHGSFNYSNTDAPFILEKDLTFINTGEFVTDMALGKPSTLAYCPNGMGANGENVLKALKNGNTVLSNGPVVTFSIFEKKTPVEEVAKAQIGEDCTILKNDLTKHFLQFEWESTEEFGEVSEINLVFSNSQGQKVKTLGSQPLLHYKGTQDISLQDLVNEFNIKLDEFFYFRIELKSYKKHGTLSNVYKTQSREFYSFTNPIWINIMSETPTIVNANLSCDNTTSCASGIQNTTLFGWEAKLQGVSPTLNPEMVVNINNPINNQVYSFLMEKGTDGFYKYSNTLKCAGTYQYNIQAKVGGQVIAEYKPTGGIEVQGKEGEVCPVLAIQNCTLTSFKPTVNYYANYAYQNVKLINAALRQNHTETIFESSIKRYSKNTVLGHINGEFYEDYSNVSGAGCDQTCGFGCFHKGLDLHAPQGSKVYAPIEGEVVNISYDLAYNRRAYVAIYNPHWKITYLLVHINNKSFQVKKGDWVNAGDYVGTTNSWNHLHIELRDGYNLYAGTTCNTTASYQNGFYDPRILVDFMENCANVKSSGVNATVSQKGNDLMIRLAQCQEQVSNKALVSLYNFSGVKVFSKEYSSINNSAEIDADVNQSLIEDQTINRINVKIGDMQYNISVSLGNTFRTQIFHDIAILHPYYIATKDMYVRGLMFGNNGNFEPDQPALRWHVALVAYRYLVSIGVINSSIVYSGTIPSDLANHPHKTEFLVLMELGYFTQSRPNDPITYGELAVVLGRVMDLVPKEKWANTTMEEYINLVVSYGWLAGQKGLPFPKDVPALRKTLANTFYKAINTISSAGYENSGSLPCDFSVLKSKCTNYLPKGGTIILTATPKPCNSGGRVERNARTEGLVSPVATASGGTIKEVSEGVFEFTAGTDSKGLAEITIMYANETESIYQSLFLEIPTSEISEDGETFNPYPDAFNAGLYPDLTLNELVAKAKELGFKTLMLPKGAYILTKPLELEDMDIVGGTCKAEDVIIDGNFLDDVIIAKGQVTISGVTIINSKPSSQRAGLVVQGNTQVKLVNVAFQNNFYAIRKNGSGSVSGEYITFEKSVAAHIRENGSGTIDLKEVKLDNSAPELDKRGNSGSAQLILGEGAKAGICAEDLQKSLNTSVTFEFQNNGLVKQGNTYSVLIKPKFHEKVKKYNLTIGLKRAELSTIEILNTTIDANEQVVQFQIPNDAPIIDRDFYLLFSAFPVGYEEFDRDDNKASFALRLIGEEAIFAIPNPITKGESLKIALQGFEYQAGTKVFISNINGIQQSELSYQVTTQNELLVDTRTLHSNSTYVLLLITPQGKRHYVRFFVN